MGIYSDGKLHGISMVVNDIVQFKISGDTPLTPEQMLDVKAAYDSLSAEQKGALYLYFYTKRSATYEPKMTTYFSWFPGTKERLEALFLSPHAVV